MKIDKAELRVVKGQGVTEVFVTSKEPLLNDVLRFPPDTDLESGTYSVTFTKTDGPKAKEEKASK